MMQTKIGSTLRLEREEDGGGDSMALESVRCFVFRVIFFGFGLCFGVLRELFYEPKNQNY